MGKGTRGREDKDAVEGLGAGHFLGNAASFGATGASVGGSVGGGIGALVGGVVGVGTGLVKAGVQNRAHKDEQFRQLRLEEDLRNAGRLNTDSFLGDQAIQQSSRRQQTESKAREAAARGGLSPAATAQLELDSRIAEDSGALLGRASAFNAAADSARADRQQVLNEYLSAQELANGSANAGKDIDTAFAAAAKATAIAGSTGAIGNGSGDGDAAQTESIGAGSDLIGGGGEGAVDQNAGAGTSRAVGERMAQEESNIAQRRAATLSDPEIRKDPNFLGTDALGGPDYIPENNPWYQRPNRPPALPQDAGQQAAGQPPQAGATAGPSAATAAAQSASAAPQTASQGQPARSGPAGAPAQPPSSDFLKLSPEEQASVTEFLNGSRGFTRQDMMSMSPEARKQVIAFLDNQTSDPGPRFGESQQDTSVPTPGETRFPQRSVSFPDSTITASRPEGPLQSIEFPSSHIGDDGLTSDPGTRFGESQQDTSVPPPGETRLPQRSVSFPDSTINARRPEGPLQSIELPSSNIGDDGLLSDPGPDPGESDPLDINVGESQTFTPLGTIPNDQARNIIMDWANNQKSGKMDHNTIRAALSLTTAQINGLDPDSKAAVIDVILKDYETLLSE